MSDESLALRTRRHSYPRRLPVGRAGGAAELHPLPALEQLDVSANSGPSQSGGGESRDSLVFPGLEVGIQHDSSSGIQPGSPASIHSETEARGRESKALPRELPSKSNRLGADSPPSWFREFMQSQQTIIQQQSLAIEELRSRVALSEQRNAVVTPSDLENTNFQLLKQVELLQAQLQEQQSRGGVKSQDSPATSVKTRRKKQGLTRSHHPVISLLDDSSSSSDEEVVASSTRMPKWRGKDLADMRAQSMLADRSNPVRWLMAYRQFAKSERYSKALTKVMLPKLWYDGVDPVSRAAQWASLMAGRIGTVSLKQLELAFLAKFARNGELALLRNQLLVESQPSGTLNGDWVRKVLLQWKWVLRWSPSTLHLTPEHLLTTIRERFTCSEMVRELHMYRHAASFTEEQLLSLCDEVDDLRHHQTAALALRTPAVSRVNQVRTDPVLDEDVLQLVEAILHQEEGNPPPLTRVFMVARNMRGRAPLFPRAEFKRFGALVGRAHVCASDEKGQPLPEVCPYHTCKRDGCRKSRCSYPHGVRSSEPCPTGSVDTYNCLQGGFCGKKHQGDKYPVYFEDRESGDYYCVLMKDERSPHSRFYRA